MLRFLLQSPGAMDDFRAPGGAVLLLYSALHSRGVDNVRDDMAEGGARGSLALAGCRPEERKMLAHALARNERS